MKKIIYSLVAMLFMGSVFTSCIPQTEPEGVREMRYAHAEYLRALADLVKANEAVAAAQAEFDRARAAVKLSIARQNNAEAEAQELLNALKAAQNERDFANILDSMERDRVNNEALLLDAQTKLEQARKNFEDAMNALEIERLSLSQEELVAIGNIWNMYEFYAGLLQSALAQIADGEKDLRNWLLAALKDQAIDAAEYKYLVALYNKEIEMAEFELKYAEQEVEFWEGLLDDMEFDYLAEAKAYEDSAEAMAPLFADLLRDSVLFVQEYEYARDEAIREADSTFINAIKDPTAKYEADIKALKDANKDNWDKMIASEPTDPANGNPKTDVFKAKGVKFEFSATGKKAYKLPEDPSGMVELYKTQAGLNGFAKNVKFVDNTLEITISEADSASYAKAVDTIWNGNQATEELLKEKTGLWSVYEDFSRDLLYDIDASGIEADSLLLKAYVAKVRNEYDSILKILKGAKKGHGQALVDAWEKKVKDADASITKLVEKVDAYQNKSGDAKNDVYKYTDNSTATGKIAAKGPVVLVSKTEKPRKVTVSTSDSKDFTLDDVATAYFDTDPNRNITFAPTPADSAAVFNAIVDYFKAIASIDEAAVPYLRFMASTDGGMTYHIDSVRADKMEFAGIQMKKTNGHIDLNGIHMAAAYDNKGMNAKDATPDPAEYDDAFGNVMNLFNHFVHKDPVLTSLYTAENNAQYAEDSGVADYVQYVKDFKTKNTGTTLDKFHKAFDTYTDVKKTFDVYTQMSDEGKAVANWMAACETYFGVEGFAGFAEGIFFDYETFTDPTWVAVFKGVPTYGYTKDKKGNIDGIAGPVVAALATPKSYQYQFVENRIKENLNAVAAGNGAYTDSDMLSSLVFELLKAEYAYNLSVNAKSISQTWEALGKVLKQAKADMDAVIAKTQSSQAKNKALADKANDILKKYRDSIKEAKKAKEDAEKAANDAFADAYEEIMVPIMHEYSDLKAKYDYYKGIADALRAAYAEIWAGGKADADAMIDVIGTKYTDALTKCAKLASGIEKAKQALAKLDADYAAFAENPLAGVKYDEDGDVIPYKNDDWKAGELTFDNELLAQLAEDIDFLYAIINEMYYDELANIEFWYEYWKAAYEAAIEYVQNK